MTSNRTPISTARCWMSRRSPTMMMDCRGGMWSWSDEPAEGPDVHRPDPHIKLLRRIALREVEDPGFERAGDVGQPGVDLPHESRFAHLGREEAAELEYRDGSDEPAAGVHDGQDADVVRLDEFERLGAGGVPG